jgi:hypothetical protein
MWHDRHEICTASRAGFHINVQNASIFISDAEARFKITLITQTNELSRCTYHTVFTNRLPLNSLSVPTGFLERRIDDRFSTRSELMT